MKPFSEITNEIKVASTLKEPGKYLAHSPDETLGDHMELVTHYFLQLISTHGLEPPIDQLLLKQWNQSERLAEMAKRLFWRAILYHDFGKVNENFQRKLGNAQFTENRKNGIDSQHSILSAFIYLAHQLTDLLGLEKELGDKTIIELIHWAFALSHNIIRHHSSRLDDFSRKETFTPLSSEQCVRLAEYLSCYEKEVSPQIIKNIPVLWSKYLKYEQCGFEWFVLLRLNFSLLTAADYYATSYYMSKWKTHYDSFGVLDGETKNKHFNNIQSSLPHNKKLYQEQAEIIEQPLDETLTEKSNANLNKLRTRMAVEVIQNMRLNTSKRLFYIEAPTGGGKTNMAFLATQELLQANPELNKVFYVFPFTTLVTQTQKAAQETLGLEQNEWMELHGRAAWKEKEPMEEEKDGLYGDERLDDIHNQFVNYPYTFLSHVRFFDILKANDKSSIYLMHRLANSVVVIDEVQAYNPELWDKMAYLLKEYSEALNIRFVVMSATLPKIGSLVSAAFCYLLPDAIERYFVNPNFADRVTFSDELLERKQPKKEERAEYLEWLVKEVFDKSELYRTEHGCVRTIIEFIFKKSTTEFEALARGIFSDYEIRVLSGTILEPRRKEVIQELKSKDNQNRNVLLIATQVVEAGVDIDMDLGFKNRSIVDSEEQLAGRVNRNVNKKACTVYLFDLDDASFIYGKDRRYKETKLEDYFEILKTKRFDHIYEKVKQWLDKTNKESGMKGTATSYTKLIGQLNFPEIDKEFTLIENKNTSVFVPLNLPVDNGAETAFSESQLQFLTEFEIYPNNDELSGERVFELYKQVITNKSSNFNNQKRNLKILQSIMSMFTFSLFSESMLVKELMSGGNQVEYGYLYLSRYPDVYDYEKGLRDQQFVNMQFL